MYWITGSIKLNESQFDKNVFDAIRQVAKKIENSRPKEVLDVLNPKVDLKFSSTTDYRQGIQKLEMKLMDKLIFPKTIEEWINLTLLSKLLQQEFGNRGIKQKYDFGVYSTDTVSYTHLTLPTKRIV